MPAPWHDNDETATLLNVVADLEALLSEGKRIVPNRLKQVNVVAALDFFTLRHW